MQSKPLKGVRVVTYTSSGAGPIAGRILGDWGADVILLETFRGCQERYGSGGVGIPDKVEDGINTGMEVIDANKRSISVDLRNPEAMDIIYKLLETSDVFISSYRAKALDAMGLGWETLHEKFPKLIYALFSGYGEKGPWKDEPGYDVVSFWTKTGLAYAMSDGGKEPAYIPMGIGDFTNGCILAGGVAAALVEQQKTGKGDKVSLSLYGSGIFAAGVYVVASQYGVIKWPMTRDDNNPVVNVYRCKDGQYVQVAFTDYPRFFPRACEALGTPDMLEDERFNSQMAMIRNKKEGVQRWDAAFAQRTSDEWVEIFGKYELPISKLVTIDEILNSEQAKENYYIYKHLSRAENKEVWNVSPPLHLGEDYKPTHVSPPFLGEHTVEIMKELGYDDTYIQDCISRKVVQDVAPGAKKYPPQQEAFIE